MAMEVPQCFGYYGNGEFSPEKLGEHFAVEDLFDFSNEDAVMTDGFFDSIGANSADSSTVTVVDSSNSSVSGGDNHLSGSFGSRSYGDSRFSSELFVPCDDLADLEWLSNFVDDSFSTKHNLQQQSVEVVCGSKPPTPESYCSDSNIRPEPDIKPAAGYHPIFLSETPLPSKSRSKRSRAAPCDWTTRLLHVSPRPPKTAQPAKKRESAAADTAGLVTRRCLHCASEKTPQWRTGPMGPKTLCNACGVRYKSGRLVPEYRPAASPTFESAKHSNSHRKVVELRRQKEVVQSPHRQQQQQHQQFLSQTSVFGGSNGVDDYLINHCGGPNFRHMI